MRGQWHEFNPWQMPMGNGTQPVLEAMDINVRTVDSPDEVGAQSSALLHQAFLAMVGLYWDLGETKGPRGAPRHTGL